MSKAHLSGKLAVILHADIVGSTALVQQNEQLAHERIHAAFERFGKIIEKYHGRVLELRGDALLARFERASDTVTAALAFQAENSYLISRIKDDLRPVVRVGIAMGEVVIANNTVTGSGVVLAQRIEQLANPGGICITAAIHESLPRRMPFDLENLGEKALKGFDDLVRVYAVELSSGESIPLPLQGERSVLPPISPKLLAGFIIVLLAIGALAYYGSVLRFPLEMTPAPKQIDNPLNKPSIAVLPFNNMSGDPEQEYFVDGMTEDLITDLSKLSGMLVIARNSVFTYKGKAVKIQQVAAELGVRYVLEGSVRRSDNNLRFNAQLIDAQTGTHIWAERYDGTLSDVFSLQDKITRKIVNALSVNLSPAEEKQQSIKYTNNVQAYDAFLKGWNLETFSTPEVFNLKVEHYKKATQLDPDYGHAFAALADLYSRVWFESRTKSIGLPSHEVLELAYEYTDLAMKNPTPLAHRVNARLLERKGKWDEAISEVGIAIALNPNDSIGYKAMSMLLNDMGRPAEAKLYLNEVSRLNPQEDTSFEYAMIQFQSEQYDEVVETLLQLTKRKPESIWSYFYLAASYGHLNRVIEGKAAIKKFDELRAGQGVAKPYQASQLYYWSIKDEASRERIRLGLLKAGMPL